jgi:hypothetical protein
MDITYIVLPLFHMSRYIQISDKFYGIEGVLEQKSLLKDIHFDRKSEINMSSKVIKVLKY